MTRPIYATVSLDAITHNLAVAQSRARGVFTWAVIKANAYGHGIERIYPALSAADGLAMLDFEEAQRVRALGWQKPILMLEGVFDAQDAALCQALALTPVVHEFRQLDWLSGLQTRIEVFVKINSGMNRLGFAQGDLPKLALYLQGNPCIQVQSWMTHFANADLGLGASQDYSASVQQALFEAMLGSIFAAHPRLRAPFSLSNSAAILNLPQTHAHSVRAGVMLYGASPFAHLSTQALGLRPAMQLNSELIAVQHLKAGDSVGYGSTFTATREMTIGIVACGYADGYPRHAPTGTPIAVEGVMTQVVGRVSMDMLTVDLSPVPQARVGSCVQLWGETVRVDDVAKACSTISYELLCALAPRVPVRLVC